MPPACSPERVSRPQSKRGTQVESGVKLSFRVKGESLGNRGASGLRGERRENCCLQRVARDFQIVLLCGASSHRPCRIITEAPQSWEELVFTPASSARIVLHAMVASIKASNLRSVLQALSLTASNGPASFKLE